MLLVQPSGNKQLKAEGIAEMFNDTAHFDIKHMQRVYPQLPF